MKINNTRKRHFSRPFGNSCHHATIIMSALAILMSK